MDNDLPCLNNINDMGIHACSSCGVCAQACSRKCITIELDKYGFYRPIIDETKCNYCGECKDVCYKYFSVDANNMPAFEGKKVVAAMDKDKGELFKVSSGGVGNRLAKYFFGEGYNVCGVVFDPQTDVCKHIFAQNQVEIELFKTSKYLQSFTFEAFSKIKRTQKYLVIGAPCQIYGLRKYIQKKKIEDNFILVDFYCRGTPSLLLWRSYKDFIQREFGLGDFDKVNFRAKSTGWHNFSIHIEDVDGKIYTRRAFKDGDLFFSFFLKNACFNEACFDCELRHNAVFSDIRLADFWGAKYYSYDDGMSLVVLCNQRGEEAWEKVRHYFSEEQCETQEYFKAQRYSKFPPHDKYSEIMDSLVKGEKLEEIQIKYGLDKQGFYKGG